MFKIKVIPLESGPPNEGHVQSSLGNPQSLQDEQKEKSAIRKRRKIIKYIIQYCCFEL